MKHTFSKQLKNAFVCISCVIVGCSATVPFLSYATTQDDLEEANSQQESYQAEQSSLSDDVSSLNDELSAVGQKIAELDQQINDKQADIDQLNEELIRLDEEKNEQYESMKLRIKFMYEHSSNDTISILLGSNSLADLLVRSEYIRQISEYDRNMLQELEDILTSTENAQTQLASDMEELTALKADVETEQSNLKSVLAEKQEAIEINSANLSEAEELALQYEEELENQRLAEEKAEAEEASREAAEAAAASSSSSSSSNSSSSSGSSSSTTTTTAISYDETDLAMLAAIIECEAANQSYEGMLAVGAVVINRVNSSKFANTISGVIYSPYQFTPVTSGRFAIVLARGATAICVQAATEVLNGNIIINALYFHVYHSDVDTYGTVIGDHIFY